MMPPITKAKLAAQLEALRKSLKRERAKNARLERTLTEALDQQSGTSEILRVISQSPTDAQPVFDAIVASAARLCGADFSAVARFDAGLLHLVAINNMSPAETEAYQTIFPRPPGRHFIIGRAFVDGRPVHVADIDADPDYDPRTREVLQRAAPYRTFLGVPILRDGVPIGAIGCGRREVKPFTATQIELVKTFADQAVIAIENVRLFTELEARNSELRVALEQQTATSEILKVIGRSTFDLRPVFETLAENAVRLCEAERGFVYRFDGQHLRLMVAYNASSEITAFIEQHPFTPGRGNSAARAALERRTIHIHDARTDPDFDYGTREVDPIRTLLSIPMLRAGELLGVITIYRLEVRPFTDSQIALMETFADQAAIAIENARLLTELQAKNASLTEALEQQTATAEILSVISSSPTDIQPVLDAVARSATRLCEAYDAWIGLREGEQIRVRAHHGPIPIIRQLRPLNRGRVSERAVVDRQVVHVHDLAASGAEFPLGHADAVKAGHRTTLGVPLLREDEAIGVILIRRREVRPFTDRQIALLETFADQAVIAVENVRLFTELEARNSELRVALEQQTATSELLKVIGRSTFDLQPVFETLAENAVRLCEAERAFIFRFDGQLLHVVATYNASRELTAFIQQHPVAPGRRSGTARAALERRTIHIHDIQTDPEYTYGVRQVDPSGPCWGSRCSGRAS